MKRRSSYGVYELIVGILLILLGIFTFTRPQSALTGLVVLYGLLATITGIGDIVFYVKMEKHTGFGPTVSLISGILSVMTGLVLMVHPGAGRWCSSPSGSSRTASPACRMGTWCALWRAARPIGSR